MDINWTTSETLGSKWVWRKKYKTDDSVNKYKAMLVVKGSEQKEVVNYFETFSPVTKVQSIRIMLEIASIYDLHIHQMDVNTVFLNGLKKVLKIKL